ncbi:MAG: class II aldolase/adducin family protein [Actinomycetia bacterium]|nr:class II aldolase/adducin family protein [Actinomycetes bacterium]
MASIVDELVAAGRRLQAAGLVVGTSGNLSARDPDQPERFWISPMAMDIGDLHPDDLVAVDEATGMVVGGRRRPSSETALHRRLYRDRTDIRAVVHTHSLYATMFAVAGEPIPPVHYAIADLGDRIPVVPYAPFGSEALADGAAAHLASGGGAVLLQNHGVVAVGTSLREALRRAELVEWLARLALGARLAGTPRLLAPAELDDVRRRLADYRQPPPADS